MKIKSGKSPLKQLKDPEMTETLNPGAVEKKVQGHRINILMEKLSSVQRQHKTQLKWNARKNQVIERKMIKT